MTDARAGGAGGPECVLRVTDLVKRYGELTAVDGLTIEVRRGEILGFLGPNGAGKTTTLKMMSGLLAPDSGVIEIDGRPVRAGARHGSASVGIAPQEIVIWDTLTCLEQLQFAGMMYDMSASAARERARHLLEVFGLEDKARRLGKTLSGGMQRRLNIALGLVHEPEILFLDEPQAGLDPQSRVLVREYLRSLRGRMTVVVTTHDMEEADKLSDRVCVIDHGRLLVMGTVAEVKGRLGGGELFEITVDADAAEALLPFLDRLRSTCTLSADGGTLSLTSARPAEAVAEVLREVADRGLRLVNLRARGATLEDVFIDLTGRKLRE